MYNLEQSVYTNFLSITKNHNICDRPLDEVILKELRITTYLQIQSLMDYGLSGRILFTVHNYLRFNGLDR